MGIASTLAAAAEPFGLQQDFRTVGDPALLVTNEITPAGFYDEVAERFGPDGYIFGPGCGNVLSMVEAFAATPRGLVMVDVDPAVVWAGRILIAALARYETAEAFVDQLFCQGPEPLGRLAEEVLAAQTSREAQRQMANQADRLRAGLGILFPPSPLPAEKLLAGWAAYYPPQDRIVPVRTFLARNYARLRELALEDRIAMLWGSIFDAGLLGLVTDLPGFRESRNLVYLSNAADHVLRRGLLATARASLLGAPAATSAISDTAGPALASPEESLRFLNQDVMPVLGSLASGAGGALFVYSKTRNGMTLVTEEGVPRYGAGDLEVNFPLDRAMVRFFEDLAASASLPPRGEPWRDARRLRGEALQLFTAALRGDGQKAAALFDGAGARELPSLDPRFRAFRIAELGLSLLRLGHAGFPARDADRGQIAGEARALLARGGELRGQAAGQAMSLLLYAQAFGLAATLLGDEELGREADSFLAAALALQTPQGAFPYDGRAGVGPQAESLLRLAVLAAYRPGAHLEEAMIRAAAALLPAIQSTGEIELSGGSALDAEGDGYLAYVTDEAALYATVRLALLFYGLGIAELEPVDLALRVGSQVSHAAAKTRGGAYALVEETV